MIIIEIMGHLGADPETRMTPNGHKLTVLRVATNVNKDETIWWQVSIWGSDFDNIVKHLKKGSAVIVVGEMGKLDIYTDKEGRPQVGYRMTARMVKFSPFGRPERQAQETQIGSYAAPAGHSTYSQAPGSGHNGYGGGPGEQHTTGAFGSNPQYTHSPQAGGDDEEAPPF